MHVEYNQEGRDSFCWRAKLEAARSCEYAMMYGLSNSARLSGLVALLALATQGPGQTFVDVTAASGIQNVPFSTSSYGSGLCCADFDGDGDVDVVIPGPVGNPIQYFRNDGAMTFTDLTAQAGLGNAFDTHPVVAADIDNDGDPDILVGNWRSPLQLFINDGTASFTEEALARGLVTQSSVYSISFGDYDRDGWLDLYLGNREFQSTSSGEANILYRNLGQGVFVDSTVGSGADHLGLTFAAPFFDYNADGWPDIICANDKGVLGAPNTILHNNGDGTFSDIGAQLNANQAMDGMGVDFVDAFNDGGMDLYVSDTPSDHLFLRWDPTAGNYVDDTYTYNLAGGGLGWAVNWFDFDNDAWQDLHVVQINSLNLVFRNPGSSAAAQTPWSERATAIGLDLLFSQYAAMMADLDDDGGIDVINRYAFHPFFPAPSGCTVHRNQILRGNWLRFLTRGVVSNRDGLGARIEVVTGSLRQQQYVRSGTGYLTGSDRRVHFGMATATQADRVEITWPSGQVQVLENVAANQTLEVVEPSFGLAGPAIVGGTTSLDLSVQGEAGLPYAMVLSFTDSPRTMLPDGRELPLQLDALSGYTIVPGNTILTNSLGLLDGNGQSTSPLVMPNLPALTGLVLFATAATFDPPGFPAVRTIFPQAVKIVVQ